MLPQVSQMFDMKCHVLVTSWSSCKAFLVIVARGIARNLLRRTKEGVGTEVPLWGPGAEPRWGSGGKALCPQKPETNANFQLPRGGEGGDIHPCPRAGTFTHVPCALGYATDRCLALWILSLESCEYYLQ